MAPSAENPITMDIEDMTPRRNVTFAINYEPQMVDMFEAHALKRPTGNDVESLPEAGAPGLENNAPNAVTEEEDVVVRQVFIQSPPESPRDQQRRVSAREKRKDLKLSRSRVRYDMQMVPGARRNRAFLDRFPCWWMQQDDDDAKQTRRSSRLTTTTTSGYNEGDENFPPCDRCDTSSFPAPFEEDTSVLWIPSKRSEWEDSVSEMTAVCTSAAIRQYKSMKNRSTSKPFHQPLSRDYIRDRVDIDDPLNGFQIRHKAGGWLQGFIMWTNFTTWTHDFKWDSAHEMSGFASYTESTPHVDVSGELANELEAQPRSGDPHAQGIVFPSIAEIALVGGLDCGEYLLRMALESIQDAKQYDYVVLQATDQSKTFYERFGFVRVGAICRYGPTSPEQQEMPIVGYRHWTHANESEKSLQLHGGPSYMMCLKLPKECSSKCPCGRPLNISILEKMMALKVEEKPTIEQLGGSLTPGPKTRRGSLSNDSVGGESASSRKGRRGSMGKSKPATGKRQYEYKAEPCSKRRKVSGPAESLAREQLLQPPVDGSKMSFAQKQYHSPWLAVPPDSTSQRSQKERARSPVKKTPPRKNGPGRKKSVGMTTSFDQNGRAFYSVRGPDGRFTRMFVTTEVAPIRQMPTPPAASQATSRSPAPAAASSGPPAVRTVAGLGNKDGKPRRINRNELKKQKVKSYPRSRLHYFNRVVKHVSEQQQNPKYYFVLHYDEPSGKIRIAPMIAKGVLSGKREGKPRYQVEIGDTDANFRTVSAADYAVVPATMVMKTPVVAHEAWDIED